MYKPLMKCKVNIRTANRIFKPYQGLFKSTIDATLDAIRRTNEPCHVKVEVMK